MCKHKCVPYIANLAKKKFKSFDDIMQCFNNIKDELHYVGCDSSNIEDYHCVCGKKLINANFISYKGEEFILGNKCIQDIFTKEDNIYKKAIYQKCKTCNCYVQKSNFQQHLDTEKHKTNLKYNQCEICNKNIKKDHKTLCKSCYMFKTHNKKKCSTCKKYNLDANKTFKNCYKCHSNKLCIQF